MLAWRIFLNYEIHVYHRRLTILAIRLPEEIEKRLTDLAAKSGRAKTFYAREAILEHFDETPV